MNIAIASQQASYPGVQVYALQHCTASVADIIPGTALPYFNIPWVVGDPAAALKCGSWRF